MTHESAEATYREMHARLWRALLAFTRSPDLASEAEAEAFSQLLGRGTAVRDPKAWIWRAAFRIAAGLLSDRTRREIQPTMTEDVEVDVHTIELLSMLGGLSDQQRCVVVLRYVADLTPAEIALVLGTSSGTVRVQLHRAHVSLRGAEEANHD